MQHEHSRTCRYDGACRRRLHVSRAVAGMRSEQGKKKEGGQDDGDAGRTCKLLVLCARVRPTVMSLVDVRRRGLIHTENGYLSRRKKRIVMYTPRSRPSSGDPNGDARAWACRVASSFTALGNAHSDARRAEAKGHSTMSPEGCEHACNSGEGYDTLEATGWLQNTSDGMCM